MNEATDCTNLQHRPPGPGGGGAALSGHGGPPGLSDVREGLLLLPARVPRPHRLSHRKAVLLLLLPDHSAVLRLPERLHGPPDVGVLHLLHCPPHLLVLQQVEPRHSLCRP